MPRLIPGTLALAAALVTASAYSQMGMMPGRGMGMMGGGPSVRRAFVMRNGVDPRYAGLSNPLEPSPSNMEAGKRLFEANCAACHGASGYGDGPAGKALNPPPANLAGLARMPMITDGYLYWTISEGGASLGSAMPSFKGTLKSKDIWQLIWFVRGL